MTTYRTYSDIEIEAATAAELVTIWHNQQWKPEKDDQTFMEHIAEGAFKQTGKPVRFSSPDEFLEDMLVIGLIEEIKTREERDE